MAPSSPFLHSFRLWIFAFALSCVCSLASAALSTKATVLIIARDDQSARSAHGGLQGYGIPYRVLIVPKEGATLPALNSSATTGNFGGIVVVSDVSYDYQTPPNPFRSALTDSQWQTLYDYQKAFRVRMVRIDVYPESQFGEGYLHTQASFTLIRTQGSRLLQMGRDVVDQRSRNL
jgi:hypothetical protein